LVKKKKMNLRLNLCTSLLKVCPYLWMLLMSKLLISVIVLLRS